MMALFSVDQLAIAYDTEKEREITARVEREKSEELASKLLIMKVMPIEDIVKLTNLSVEEVNAINIDEKV